MTSPRNGITYELWVTKLQFYTGLNQVFCALRADSAIELSGVVVASGKQSANSSRDSDEHVSAFFGSVRIHYVLPKYGACGVGLGLLDNSLILEHTGTFSVRKSNKRCRAATVMAQYP